MEKYKDMDEKQKVTETMNLLLSPILPNLNSETAIIVNRALYLLGEIEIDTHESEKEIYNKGFTDGQKALAEHLKLCKEELLDKIRTEIEGKYRIVLKDTPKDDWAIRWNECIDEVLEVIDKHRESEENK